MLETDVSIEMAHLEGVGDNICDALTSLQHSPDKSLPPVQESYTGECPPNHDKWSCKSTDE